ncbi:MAG: UbiD family decarboxylase domain-containing protein, partial [Phycisphaerales bacterium]
MYQTLGDFVQDLDRRAELVRITEPISPLLEITEITDRVSKSRCANDPGDWARRTDPRFWDRGGHALLFENVVNPDGSRSPFPVLINAFGSYSRMAMALHCGADLPGVSSGIPGGFEAIGHRIGELVKPEPPKGIREAIAKARQFAPLLKIGPKRGKSGVCQEVVHTGDAIDLTTIPALRCWPHDGDYHALGYPHPAQLNDPIPRITPYDQAEASGLRGRYITLAGIHTIHADDADAKKPSSHNIGMYRVQMLGRDRVAMHWHMHHDGANHWRSWKRKGQRMPVAIALGGESVLPYAATAPLPPGISELLMAGFLNSTYTLILFHMLGYLLFEYQEELGFASDLKDDTEAADT